MLAIEQVVGRAGLQPPMLEPGCDDQLELARAAAEPDMVDRRILRRHLDRHRVDVGGRRPAPWARDAWPRRRAGRCRCRCRRDWRRRRPCAFSRSSASRQPAVVSCWPVPKARPASISNATAPGGTRSRCAGVWTKKRPARIGSSPAWRQRHPILVAEPLGPRRCAARARHEAEQQRDRPRGPARPRNRRPSARRRPRPRWSSAPAASPSARRREMSSFSASASALVQGRVTFQLIARAPAGAARRAARPPRVA